MLTLELYSRFARTWAVLPVVSLYGPRLLIQIRKLEHFR